MPPFHALTLFALVFALPVFAAAENRLRPIPLKNEVTKVQPMTGIVIWDTSPGRSSEAIQLEFSYLGYGRMVTPEGKWDWSIVEEKLADIASRGHQAIFRFYLVYPGRPAETPAHLRALSDYEETEGESEGKKTGFPDWSHPALPAFIKEFHSAFAARYDSDPRLAFVQVGFGLWGEYHIYDGPFELGKTFPERAIQGELFRHFAGVYKETPWSVSVDAAKSAVSPFQADPSLLELKFGVFDDSFLCEEHAHVNEKDWNALGRGRFLSAPAGGEFSYYSDHDQKNALAPDGPHGISYEKSAKAFGISYIIGDDQPNHQSEDRLREAGIASGYRFRVTKFASAVASGEMPGRSEVVVRNEGIAPIYHDAFVTVDGVRAKQSLKGLAPGNEAAFIVDAGGKTPKLSITSDRLVPGQVIGFDADLTE
jgi:hypothetical protein